jgi:hypothetical protein
MTLKIPILRFGLRNSPERKTDLSRKRNVAEFEALSTLRNVLLAPLSKVRTETGSTDLPSHSANSTVSRHDHHNIEVKTVSELGNHPSMVETDIYLFVPRSFEIGSVGKAELIKDYRTRIRLALPSGGDLGAAAFEAALQTLELKVKALEDSELVGEQIADINTLLSEEVLEAVKDLCAIVSETLKQGSIEHCRQFLISHTLMATAHAKVAGLENLQKQVCAVHLMIDRARKTATSKLQSVNSVFNFFDEFISQLYVQYLSAVRSEFVKIGAPKDETATEIYLENRKRLEKQLDAHQEQEALHRQTFVEGVEEADELDRERRLVRMSHLKKFFQSKTFIDVNRRQSAKKVSESTATIGTAAAALVAALLETYSRSNIANAAFNGVIVISLGVIFYTLRDRLKDWAKNRFQEKALKMFPDYEQSLMAREKRIGTAKEWFHMMASNDLPDEIKDLRKIATKSEMERRLPVDIFHCRKVQEVNATGVANAKQHIFSQALHENTRINFERYLKHMDDPFKEIVDLDKVGNFRKLRSHRVYHFYLCVKTVTKPLDKNATHSPRREQTLFYRLILDKRGVVRIENLGTEAAV